MVGFSDKGTSSSSTTSYRSSPSRYVCILTAHRSELSPSKSGITTCDIFPSILSAVRTMALIPVVGIFRAFENMRDMRYMRDMLYSGTYFCISLIYPIYRTKYNKLSSIKYLEYLTPNLK